jgi:hypothetical protein
LPVVAWSPEALSVAIWEPAHPWSELDRRGWVRSSDIAPKDWGVWMSREELLALLRRTLAAGSSAAQSPQEIRLRAVLGRLLDDRPLADTDLRAGRSALPAPALAIGAGSIEEASDRLARLNEQWTSQVSWGGLSFGFVPLEALP